MPTEDEISSVEQESVSVNGLSMNGLSMNGLSMNGLSMNGLTMNGLTVNGLSMNGLSMNGLSMNGLSMNGLSMNGLSMNGLRADLALHGVRLASMELSGQAEDEGGGDSRYDFILPGPTLRDDDMVIDQYIVVDSASTNGLTDTPEGRELLKYVIKCALPENYAAIVKVAASLFDDAPIADEFVYLIAFGAMALAPGFASGPATTIELEFINACLLAHTNPSGAMNISLRGNHPRLIADTLLAETAKCPTFDLGPGSFCCYKRPDVYTRDSDDLLSYIEVYGLQTGHLREYAKTRGYAAIFPYVMGVFAHTVNLTSSDPTGWLSPHCPRDATEVNPQWCVLAARADTRCGSVFEGGSFFGSQAGPVTVANVCSGYGPSYVFSVLRQTEANSGVPVTEEAKKVIDLLERCIGVRELESYMNQRLCTHCGRDNKGVPLWDQSAQSDDPDAEPIPAGEDPGCGAEGDPPDYGSPIERTTICGFNHVGQCQQYFRMEFVNELLKPDQEAVHACEVETALVSTYELPGFNFGDGRVTYPGAHEDAWVHTTVLHLIGEFFGVSGQALPAEALHLARARDNESYWINDSCHDTGSLLDREVNPDGFPDDAFLGSADDPLQAVVTTYLKMEDALAQMCPPLREKVELDAAACPAVPDCGGAIPGDWACFDVNIPGALGCPGLQCAAAPCAADLGCNADRQCEVLPGGGGGGTAPSCTPRACPADACGTVTDLCGGDLVCPGCAFNEACDPVNNVCGPSATCGDGVCDGPNGETCSNCATDCGACTHCGNRVCQGRLGENQANCRSDCTETDCGDGLSNDNDLLIDCDDPDCDRSELCGGSGSGDLDAGSGSGSGWDY